MNLFIDRLKAQLLTSGLQQKDQPLFQVINQLIDAMSQLVGVTQGLVTSGSGSGSPGSPSSAGSVFTATPFGYPVSFDDSPVEGVVLEGPRGIQGIQGIPGNSAAIVLDGQDGIEGFPGFQGQLGPRGLPGPASPLIELTPDFPHESPPMSPLWVYEVEPWVDIPFNAGFFSAQAPMVWTVVSANISTMRRQFIGPPGNPHTMNVILDLGNSVITAATGAETQLHFWLGLTMTPAKTFKNAYRTVGFWESFGTAIDNILEISVTAGGLALILHQQGRPAWADAVGVNVSFSLTIPLI